MKHTNLMDTEQILNDFNKVSDNVEKAYEIFEKTYDTAFQKTYISDIVNGETINIKPENILIDDVDIMKCDIKSLRDNVAYVPQDNFLFSDKIRNNIAFSDRETDMQKIKLAAKFADVDDNIVAIRDNIYCFILGL